MILKILLSIFLQIAITAAAPLQLPSLNQLHGLTQQQIPVIPMLQALQTTMQQQTPPQEMIHPSISLLQPLQGTVQQQQLALQEQMFALQQFQALQRMNLVSSPMNTPPILVIFPNNEPDVRHSHFNTNSLKYQNPEEIGDEESEVIDAEQTEEIKKKNPLRAVLLMPNTRSIIGDFISSIPFLPIEINVPDSISWIYNGIAGIISVIGQSLPFRPQMPNSETQNKGSVKSIFNRINKQEMPFVVIPLG